MSVKQRFALTATTTDLAQAVSLAEAANYVRVVDTADYEWLDGAIRAATNVVESYTGRQLVTKSYNLKLDSFPAATDCIEIPKPPLQSVDSVQFVSGDGSTTSIATTSLRVDTDSEPGRVAPIYDSYWPSARLVTNAVTIGFTGGYGDASTDIPQALRQASMFLVAHWYANREAIITGTITKPVEMQFRALCDTYRIWELY